MLSTGTESAPSTATVTSNDAAGRAVMPVDHALPRARARRGCDGGGAATAGPRSIRSPSSASTAGSTVTEPTAAIATTRIAPSAIDVKTPSPVNVRPGQPDHDREARRRRWHGRRWPSRRSSAASLPRAGPPLLALAPDVEQRVVDADGQADEDHDRARSGCPSGAICEITPSAPSAPATEVRPSSSGTTAATSAPKATMRMISVIGSETSSAWLRSSLTTLLMAWPAEASPASCSVAPGCEAATDATTRSSGATCSSALSGSPRSCTCTSCSRPAGARQGRHLARALDGGHAGQTAGADLERRDRRAGAAGAAGADQHALGRRRLEVSGGQSGVGTSRFAGARARVGEGLGAGRGAGEDAAGDEDQPQGDDRPRVAGRGAGDRAHRSGETPGRLTYGVWDT